MRFTIEFKRALTPVITVEGLKDVGEDHITVKTVKSIVELEQQLEFLTGYRVHIKEAS
jgi:hypothetical protein